MSTNSVDITGMGFNNTFEVYVERDYVERGYYNQILNCFSVLEPASIIYIFSQVHTLTFCVRKSLCSDLPLDQHSKEGQHRPDPQNDPCKPAHWLLWCHLQRLLVQFVFKVHCVGGCNIAGFNHIRNPPLQHALRKTNRSIQRLSP